MSLKLVASISTVGVPSDALQLFIDQYAFFGPYSAEFVGDFLVVPETTFDFLQSDLQLPAVTVFDEQSKIVSQLQVPQDVVVPSSTVSPCTKRPFIALLQIDRENRARIVIYAVTSNGQIAGPYSSFDLSTLDAFVDFNNTAEVVAGFSSNGRFLAITYSAGGPDFTNRLAVLKVHHDGVLEFFAQIDVPDALFVQQNVVFRQIKKGEYLIVAGYNSLDEDSSRLISYRFSASSKRIVQLKDVPVNQFIFGYDADPKLHRLIVLTREAAVKGLSVQQDPGTPFEGAAAPKDELRLYDLGDLSLVNGWDLGATGYKAKWNPDGKSIALTFAAAESVNGVTGTLEEPVVAPAQVPSVLGLFSYKCDELSLRQVKVAAPFAFGLAWKCDDVLAVAGVPTQTQKDFQKYKVC